MEISIAKRVALSLLGVLFMTAYLAAQAQDTPLVTVRSSPTGCTVILAGDHNVVGITPTTFAQKLQGYYTITAYREGYETYHSRVLLTGKDVTTIDISLVPKTRVKAAARSLLFPGWGQIYSGSKTRGALFTVATAAAAITVGLLHLDYDSKRNSYEEIRIRFLDTREVARREAMLDELYKVQKDADDAEQARKTGFYVLLGIWAYNLIDAFLFFPDFNINISGTEISFHPDLKPEGVKLVGEISF